MFWGTTGRNPGDLSPKAPLLCPEVPEPPKMRHFCAQKFQNRPKVAKMHVAAMSRPCRGHVAAMSRPCRGHVAAMSRPYLGIFRENEAVLGCDVHFGQVFSSIAPVSADFGEKTDFLSDLGEKFEFLSPSRMLLLRLVGKELKRGNLGFSSEKAVMMGVVICELGCENVSCACSSDPPRPHVSRDCLFSPTR